MDGWWSDLRYAFRFLARNRGTTIVAVLALTLGIGAATAIYGVAYDVLLRPLPYPDSERIVAVFQVRPDGHRMRQMSEPNFEDLEAQNRSLAALAVYGSGVVSVVGGSEPVRAHVTAVSPAFFRALGVRPERGRAFPEETSETAEPAAVVSHAFWRRSLGSEADLSRLSLRFSGRVHPVIGVLPPDGCIPGRHRRLRPQGPRAAQPAPHGPQLAGDRTPPRRRLARGGARGPRHDRATPAAAVRRRHADGRRGGPAAARGAQRPRPGHAPGAARQRRLPAAGRLRQRRQPAAGAVRGAPPRARDAHGARRGTAAPRAPARDGGARALRRRRGPGPPARARDRARRGSHRPGEAAAGGRGGRERARARLRVRPHGTSPRWRWAS